MVPETGTQLFSGWIYAPSGDPFQKVTDCLTEYKVKNFLVKSEKRKTKLQDKRFLYEKVKKILRE